MKTTSERRIMTWQQIGLILLVIVSIVIAGFSGLVYPSEIAPLVIGAGLIGLVVLFYWTLDPAWTLFLTLFILLLPAGLLDADLQSFLNRWLTILAFGMWVLNVLIQRRKIRLTLSATFLLAFMLWGAVTIFWAKAPDLVTFTLQVYALRFLLFLLVLPNLVTNKTSFERLMKVLALNGWLLVLVSAGIAIFVGYTPGTRLKALDINENELGILSILLMSGVLWGAVKSSHRNSFWKRILAMAYIVLAIGLIAMSGSRGSTVSFIITLATFWWWKSTRPLGKLGLTVLIVALLVFPSIFRTIIDRFLVTTGDTILGNREVLWQAAWQLIGKHPLGGTGIGNAVQEVMPYLQSVRYLWGNDGASVHNPVLAIWADTGLIGLLLYLGVLATAMWSFADSYSYFKKQRDHYLLPYFHLLSSVFMGFMASWIKGGGMEFNRTYFLMIALLLIPGMIRLNFSNGEQKTLAS